MKMEKIRILMVAGSMHVGGIENQLMHLARNADKNLFQIDFTSDKEDAFYRKEIEELGCKFIYIPVKSRNNPFKYCQYIYRIMKSGNYDVVHSHELFHSGITLFLAWLAKVPCRFSHAHNWCEGSETGGNYTLSRKVYHSIMRFLINRFSTVKIACSSWAGKFLYGEKATKKPSYHLVYNSVDTEKFLLKYEQNENAHPSEINGWKNVLNVARFSTVKNQTFLVDVAEELRSRGNKICILCVGSGNEAYMNKVYDKINEKQLSEYIQLIGIRKDIDVLMRKCSAFVLPSKYEGMPLVMIEAQASGLPCISANTYSPEVDFEIGLVEWLSLDSGVTAWANAIQNAVLKQRASKDAVLKAIQNKKLDSKMFSQTLCDLYSEDYILRKGQ
jgi:glycosyltransferase EpsF